MRGTRSPRNPQAGGDERASFDPFEHHLASSELPRSARTLPGLVRRGVGIARIAAPRLFVLTIVLQLAGAALLGAQVLLGKVALEQIFRADAGDGDFGTALPALVALLAASALSSFAASALTQMQRLMGERVVRTTWGSILDVTTSVNLATFESPAFFDELQRVQANALIRPLTLVAGITQLIGGGVAVIGLTIALLAISPVLVPILLVAGVPLSLLSRLDGKLEFRFVVAQTTASRLRFYFIQLLTTRAQAKELRAFRLQPHFTRLWNRSFDAYLSDLDRHVMRRLAVAALSALSSILVLTAAVGLLVYFVIDDRLSIAAAGAALISARLLSSRVEMMFKGIASLFESALYLGDLEAFLRRRPQPLAEGETVEPVPALDTLEVDNVSFSYPASEKRALSDVSLRLEAGQVVALVGENGSGKTTLAKLIAGLFEPTEGTVRWNGRDTADIGQAALSSEVAVIFQDFVQYLLSAQENITLGAVDRASDVTGAQDAAARSGAADFIAALPDGYETRLGREFGGVDLSLGQWQRIAIARAFFRDASLLILDEPTASLDPRAEADLFDRIRALAGGRTVLLISHRFSTVRSADQIVVMHDGAVEELGTHDELMSAGRRYAELFELQALAYR
jgi:ATP-binding cassette subfamily B protein